MNLKNVIKFRNWSGLFWGLCLCYGISCLAEEASLSTTRAVFHTNLGNIVVGFYSREAPKTVEQIVKLMSMGVYDGATFFRVTPGFLAQVASPQYERSLPLNALQSAAIHSLPLETTPLLKHQKWVLSMSRQPEHPDSGDTSFCILLANAPHLDGQYTVFGKVLQGMETLSAIEAFPRDGEGKPRQKILIRRISVVENPADVARVVAWREREEVSVNWEHFFTLPKGVLIFGLFVVTGMVLLAVVLSQRLSYQRTRSIQLIGAFIGSFVLLSAFAPLGQLYSGIGAVLIIAFLLLLRLMTGFEPPKDVRS